MIRVNAHFEINGSVRSAAKWFEHDMADMITYVERCFYAIGRFDKRFSDDREIFFNVIAAIVRLHVAGSATFHGCKGEVHFYLMDRDRILKKVHDVEKLFEEFETYFASLTPVFTGNTPEEDLPF